MTKYLLILTDDYYIFDTYEDAFEKVQQVAHDRLAFDKERVEEWLVDFANQNLSWIFSADGTAPEMILPINANLLFKELFTVQITNR